MSGSVPSNMGPLRRVILQPTGFCNIDCSYCYLPDRRRTARMSMEVVEAVGDVLARSDLLAAEIEVRWHAGEPLTVPHDFYRDACASLRTALSPHARVRFSLQTNATLVTDAWCDLFESEAIEIGVSLDGPAHLHDAYRRTRQDRGTFHRAMRGVAQLRERELAFDLISVVTPLTLANIDDYVQFVAELHPRSVGLNPEETEGEHTSELFIRGDFDRSYRDLLTRMYDLQARTGIVVRQLAAMRDLVLAGDLPFSNEQVEPLMMLNVDLEGSMSTYSPELLGWKERSYDDFTFGNVLDTSASLTDWSPGFRRLATEIAEGRERCRRECDYFAVCGGGAAANKWAENGSFASTVTDACRTSIMAVCDTVLTEMERRSDTASPTPGGG